jgi:structural maintenance of chromosome 3 (chondroitin sulfate proteoglycan 6)
MSAYVEVCFDNSQDRFHTGKPEFHLRRTIGQKKDEYSIDRKNATKAEVQQILESAGFSRSNPYYIVPQGRVTALTNMKDVERLNLLKEISGSNVYETRRADSLKLLQETDNKRGKIDDLVVEIEKRLEELEGERKELEDYNKKDREKRCLSYVIHRHTEISYEEKIAEIDARRQNGMADTDTNRDLFIQNENEIKRIDREIEERRNQIELLRAERAELENDRRESARAKAKIELDHKELTDGQSTAQKTRKRHETELKNVQQQIKAREDELQQIRPQYAAKKAEELDLQSQLTEAEGQRKRLEDKQGRTAFYKNKRQRDDALRAEIDDVNMGLATRKAVLMDRNEEIVALQKEIEALENEVAELRSAVDNQNDDSLTYAAKVQDARDAKERLMDEKKGLWREEHSIKMHYENARSKLQEAEYNLSAMMDHQTSRGLASLHRFKAQHNLDGVYGTVAELMKVNKNYKTAAEETAGASLFHVVCDNDATATKLVDLLNKEKAGRLTCIPLNRIHPRHVDFPKAPDALPLIEKLDFDPRFEKAFRQVFGKAIICPDLATAASYARTHGVHALTAEGDSANKKGVLTGGWHDPSRNRLDTVQTLQKRREEVEGYRSRQSEITRKLQELEQKITAKESVITTAEHEQTRAERSYGGQRQQLRAKEVELQNKQEALERQKGEASALEAGINDLVARQSDLESELGSEFKKALSEQEEQHLVSLASTVQDLRRKVAKIAAERLDLESRKAEIEVELRENLQPSLDELLSQEKETSGSGSQSVRLKECERKLKAVNRTLASYDEKITQVENDIEQTSQQLEKFEAAKADKQSQNRELARAIERHQTRMEKSMTERAQAMKELARAQKEIRELGTLPDEAWSTYGKWSPEKVRYLQTGVYPQRSLLTMNSGFPTSCQSQRSPEEILPRQQESLRTIRKFHETETPTDDPARRARQQPQIHRRPHRHPRPAQRRSYRAHLQTSLQSLLRSLRPTRPRRPRRARHPAAKRQRSRPPQRLRRRKRRRDAHAQRGLIPQQALHRRKLHRRRHLRVLQQQTRRAAAHPAAQRRAEVSLRPRPRLRDPAMRSRALLSLRRN